MSSSVSFILDGKPVEVAFNGQPEYGPTTTVLNYLRGLPAHKGVKEGCAEGDCGACTVVLGESGPGNTVRYKSVDSCLVFLPMIHGKQLVTVENLKLANGHLHPVQRAMVETNGSQCGYCTPGIIMSMFALYKNNEQPTRAEIDDALTGNLCRCTGYKPIIEAAAAACTHSGADHFSDSEANIAATLDAMPKESLHIKTPRQQYFRPATVQEALTHYKKFSKATIITGATDVALRVTKKHELLPAVIDLSAIEELQRVTGEASGVKIGAGVTLSEVMARLPKKFGALTDILSVFGSQQIRNVATLGGNIGTASPIGDTLPVLMAYGAKIVLQSLEGTREVPCDTYFTGYRQTVRKANELVVGVVLPTPRHRAIVKAYKVSKRKDLDISTVSAGFKAELSTDMHVGVITLAYGGMADRPKRATAAEQFLVGKKWDRKTIEQAMLLIDKQFTPIADVRGSAEFRRVAARNLLLKFWSETVGKEK